MLANTLLQQLTPWLGCNRWFVGFSGGMDSTVLLHLLATLKQQHKLPKLSAIYIHHGLQEVAENWPLHCQQVCDELAIPLKVIKVKVMAQASLEEAARNARYQAFTEVLQKGDVLFTAQHQHDQAETLLFRLARGAGVRGLASIPPHRSLGEGELVRPLLQIPYKQLKNYAIRHRLQWVDDPSNEDISFARNYIRHQLIPVLEKQWPSAVSHIEQASRHLQEAQQLLNELAIVDLQKAEASPPYPWLTVPSLLLAPLANLSFPRQKNALSYWLSQYTLLPTTQHWQGWQDLLFANESASPIWKLHQAELHRTNDRIWLLTNDWLTAPTPLQQRGACCSFLPLPTNGYMTLQHDLPPDTLTIRYRQGGEKIRLAQRGNRDLKRLFNEMAIPPFIRQRIPLLVDQHNNLLAVANFPQWRDKEIGQSIIFNWIPNTNLH